MKKFLAVISAAMLAAPVLASAQPTIPMPAPGSVSVKGREQQERFRGWSVLHLPDSMTDELTYAATLSSQEGEYANFVVSCRPSTGIVGMAYKAENLISFTKERATFTYRFDDEPATSLPGILDGQNLVIPRSAVQAFAAGLAPHYRLRTRATDSLGNSEERSFDLLGAAAAIDRMRVLCAGGR